MRINAGRISAVVLAVGLFTLLLGTRTAAGDGIGVYPTNIDFEGTVRGGEYLRTIGVLHGGDSERTFRFQASGELASWLSFIDPNDETKVVDSVSVAADAEGRVVLRLLVPADAANGKYSGSVLVAADVGTGSVGKGAGSFVSVGAEIEVTVEITGKQKVAGTLVDAAVDNVEVGYPLQVRTTVQNYGNVTIVPEIKITVATKATVVGESTFSEETIYPNQQKTLMAKWDTANAIPGQYNATIAVFAGELALGRKELTFTILPLGTLSRQGVLDRLELLTTPIPGAVAKVGAQFRNTGQIDSKAVFVGEVYRNSVLVDSVTSVEKLVSKGDGASLEIFVPVPAPGSYRLVGKINFEGKESLIKELTFEAVSPSTSLDLPTLISVVGAAVVAVGIVGLIVWRRRHRVVGP